MTDAARADDTRPLSVMFVVTSLHGGGAEYVGRSWMRFLAESGHTVRVVTTSAKPTDEYLPEGVEPRPLGGVAGHRAKASALRALIRRERPDAVVAMQSYPNLVLIAATTGMPARERPAVLVSERNLVSIGLRDGGPRHRAKHWLARRGYRMADHVIAISHPVAAELVSAFGVPSERVTVVHNPAMAKVDGLEQIVRPALGGADVELVVATRLVPQKRPQLAVRVAAELERRGVRTRLTVFGVGPLEASMRAEATRLGVDLDVRGWAERWFEECSASAVFLLVSDREGFGNVLVEAAAAGVGFLTIGRALGVADAVVPSITGELAAADDPASIADAVQLAARIEVRGIERWLEHFSLESSGTALERLLRRVIAVRGGAGS